MWYKRGWKIAWKYFCLWTNLILFVPQKSLSHTDCDTCLISRPPHCFSTVQFCSFILNKQWWKITSVCAFKLNIPAVTWTHAHISGSLCDLCWQLGSKSTFFPQFTSECYKKDVEVYLECNSPLLNGRCKSLSLLPLTVRLSHSRLWKEHFTATEADTIYRCISKN